MFKSFIHIVCRLHYLQFHTSIIRFFLLIIYFIEVFLMINILATLFLIAIILLVSLLEHTFTLPSISPLNQMTFISILTQYCNYTTTATQLNIVGLVSHSGPHQTTVGCGQVLQLSLQVTAL